MKPTQPEMVMYKTGEPFRGDGIRLYAQRALISEETAEKNIRAALVEHGMSPETGEHAEPSYRKAN